MAPGHRKEVADEEGSNGTRSFKVILIIQGAQRCIVLCCFVSIGTEDESFEQESDTTRCVFQEDNSARREEKRGKEKQSLQ